MAQVNIRIDDDVKNKADKLFGELGLNMSTAVNIFLKQSLRQGGIPFEITARTDAFYSKTNMECLTKSIKNAEDGNLDSHELIEN